MNKRKIHIVLFGIGNVGGTLIHQLQKARQDIQKEQNLEIKIEVVTNSTKALFEEIETDTVWRDVFDEKAVSYQVEDVISYVKQKQWKDIIAVDATASQQFVLNYEPLIQAGFHMVSANKIANTLEYKFYHHLRNILKENQRDFRYETNVGAGLPVIDTIKNLHQSGEKITRIRGVFSGSLSFIFNEFSDHEKPFSEVLSQAMENGYTEPDPREDLNGNDVARKLLILARELDLKNEFKDIKVQNLIPKTAQNKTRSEFLDEIEELNPIFAKEKSNLSQNHVLRYIGDFSKSKDTEKGDLKVELVSVDKNTPLGSLKGSDAIFEIFTESYGSQPLVIQGAGAGSEVTARGVFGDIVRVAQKSTLHE